jgi:hypothetical protein
MAFPCSRHERASSSNAACVGGHASFPNSTHLRHRRTPLPFISHHEPHTPHTIQSHITMDSSKKLDPNQRPSLSEGFTTLQTPTTPNSLTGEASSAGPDITKVALDPNIAEVELTMRQKLNIMHKACTRDKKTIDKCIAESRLRLDGLTQPCKKVDEIALRANTGTAIHEGDYSESDKVDRENHAIQHAQSSLNGGNQKDLIAINNTPPPHESSSNLKRAHRSNPVDSPPRDTKRPRRAPSHISISSGSESSGYSSSEEGDSIPQDTMRLGRAARPISISSGSGSSQCSSSEEDSMTPPGLEPPPDLQTSPEECCCEATPLSLRGSGDPIQVPTIHEPMSMNLRGPFLDPCDESSSLSFTVAIRAIKCPGCAVVALHTSTLDLDEHSTLAPPDIELSIWVDQWLPQSFTEPRGVGYRALARFLRSQRAHTKHADGRQ